MNSIYTENKMPAPKPGKRFLACRFYGYLEDALEPGRLNPDFSLEKSAP